MPPSPQETRTYTPIENPKSVRFIRVLWALVAIVMLVIYFIGFADFYGVLRRGMPLVYQSLLVLEAGQVVIHQPSAALQEAGIQDGDVLLSIALPAGSNSIAK